MRKKRQSKNKKDKIVIVNEKQKGTGSFEVSKINPVSAQDTIPFDEVYENGVFRLGETFSLIFKFENIDYKIMRDNEKDEFYRKYTHFLDTIPQNINYQEFIMNYPIDKNKLSQAMLPTTNANNISADVYNDYSRVMSDYIVSCEENSCEQILIGSFSFTPKTKLDDVNIIFKYFKSLQDEALNLSTKLTILKPEETFKILHRMYHMSNSEPFVLPKAFLQADVNLKDYICPSSFKFKSRLIECGSEYSCVMFAKRFSRECDDEFITDILDNTYNICVSKHLMRIDKTDALKILKRQMDDLEGRLEKRREINHKRGGDFIPFSLQNRENELKHIQNKLSDSNCDLFAFANYIYISAPTEQDLDDLKDFIKHKAMQHQVIVDVLTGPPQQEKGLQCVLPFANPVTIDDAFLGQPFYFLTDEVANFIPFSYKNDYAPDGIYYGFNTVTHTPIIINRSDGLNANGFTIGTSGSGKSMLTKAEFFAAATKYPDDEFIIIDPENEYKPLSSPFDAEIIKLSPNTTTYINLFDTDMSYAEDGASAISLKSDFIMTFCEASKGSSLTASERSVIDRCIKLVYQDFILSDGDKSKIPTLTDFYDVLSHQTDEAATDIALALELYTKGSFNIFAHKTNIEYHKKFIIYDIFEMGNQLQTVGLLVLLELLWQRVIENKKRGVRTWVWCDEFSVMFNDKNSDVYSTGDFFAKVYKRIRKHGGIATGATQNITEMIDSRQAMTMLQNSEFLILLAQKEEDLKKLQTMLNLSDNQIKYLNTDEPGTGLIKLGKRIIPFENKMPKNSLMYQICSTKFKEVL